MPGLVLLLVATACGTRLDHESVAAVGNGDAPVDLSPPAGAPAAPAAVGAATVDAATPEPATVASASVGAAAPSGPTVHDRRGGSEPAAVAPAARPAAAGKCAQPLEPVVLGQTLATSGLVGATIGGLRAGLAIWAKDVNARGGLECHPVRLIQLDDASDPARVTANWNSLIHDRGAVAIVGGGVPIAIAALRTAAERDRVPVVGGDVTAEDWVQSPYLFPTGGAPLTSYDGGVIDAARVAEGPRKAGLFYCVEASICTGLKNNFPKSAERAQAALGPIAATSLTQPDYTSECQTMKAAGVNTLFLGLDGSASIRAARSCASLNYFPTISMGAIGLSAAAAADAGLRRNKTFLGSGVVPYTTTDTPGIRAFHAATQRWMPAGPIDQQTLLGWAAGKLLEAALAQVSGPASGGAVTTDLILDGLWRLKNEKLDGISPGATFTRGRPATAVDCYYGLRLDEHGFGAVAGSRPTCFDASHRPVTRLTGSPGPHDG
ncbi:hypothetical protein GCM10009547_02400 [Sporichthya brevicatena]|uniref:Leucine-binding protein domain-containing protein n=1 Tax=Sporichthya brevicatena TaxID=171442 RepID=A0ABN1G4Z2_9ACTN